MAKQLKLRRGTTTEHSTFTGAEGEVTVDTTKDTVVVHDGSTAGGIPLAKESSIPTGALASLDSVNASTIDDNSVGAAEINVSGNGTAGQFLSSDGDGTMTWADVISFDTGTRMLFAQTAAPTGWTKDTTNYNNHSLRVVTGTASTGGTVDFTTAFASKTPTGSVTITSVTGSAGATTLSTSQIPAHTHTEEGQATPSRDGGGGGAFMGVFTTKNTGSTGGGGSHSHSFSFSSGSGTFSGNAIDLAVKYLDVITATKD